MKDKITSQIAAQCPWRGTVHWFDCIDSTNTRAKLMAQNGAPHGTVLVAATQTGGRGRLGRTFSCCEGKGVYLSVILRPQVKPDALMHLTCAAAVATCGAVHTCAGIMPNIKWVNDLMIRGKKLGGILTELAVNAKTGIVDHAIVGIGINCRHEKQDFPSELQEMATSLWIECRKDIPCESLAAAMIYALWEMDAHLLEKETILDAYRKNCINLKKEVCVLQGDQMRYATALDIDENGALCVRFDNGETKTLNAGEVSIRGVV